MKLRTIASNLFLLIDSSSRTTKISFFLLSLLYTLNTFLEILGLFILFSIFRLFGTEDNSVSSLSASLNNLFHWLPFKSPLISGSLLLILTSFIGFLSRLLVLYRNQIFAARIGASLSESVISYYVNLSYIDATALSSSVLINTINVHIPKIVASVNSCLVVISSAIISLSIIASLFVIDYRITLVICCLYALFYFALAALTKPRLSRNSSLISRFSESEISLLNIIFANLKLILVSRLQKYFTNSFLNFDVPMRRLIAQNEFIATVPRYALESIAVIFVGFVLIVSSLNRPQSDLINVVSILAVFALGSQKLLPSLHSIFSSLTTIVAYSDSIDQLQRFLPNAHSITETNSVTNINLKSMSTYSHSEFKDLVVDDVSFLNPKTGQLIFSNATFTIKRGEKIGLVGPSGAGKSSLLNIILGIVHPSSGQVRVNNHNIYEYADETALLAWQSYFAFVPQEIFILDGSLRENVSFPYPADALADDQYLSALQQSMLNQETFSYSLHGEANRRLGENGLGISGGQRQRIGIARALATQKTFLILDESTSALDILTECSIFDNLNSSPMNYTMLIATHRTDTLAFCDRILEIKDGLFSVYPSYEHYATSSATSN